MASPIALDAMELARRMSSVVSHVASGVGFGVWHGPDSPWAFPQALCEMSQRAWHHKWAVDESHQYDSLWTDALGSGAFGHGIAMAAIRMRDPLTVRSTRDRRTDLAGNEDVVQWYGTERPNPGFMSGESRIVELLVRLPVDIEHVRVADAVVLGQTLAQVASTVWDRDRPVAFAYAPVSPPLGEAAQHGDYGVIVDGGNQGAWPAARSFGLRFAVATRPDEVSVRSGIYDTVARHCRSIGAELWIGDRRGDRRAGQWYHAEALDPVRYRRLRRGDGPSETKPVDYGLPVTFVGPARVGAVAELLGPLAERGVPILSTSVDTLEQVGFIHVLVAVPHDLGHLRTSGGFTGPAAEVIGKLLPGTQVELDQAKDHRGVVGPGHAIDLCYDHDALAVWAVWQVRDRPDALYLAVTSLRSALADELPDGVTAEDVNIEYIVCQRRESGHLRGRCKLALPADVDTLPAQDRGQSRNQLCAAVEEAWRRRLDQELGAALVEVEFTWQEWRLGRWSALDEGAT